MSNDRHLPSEGNQSIETDTSLQEILKEIPEKYLIEAMAEKIHQSPQEEVPRVIEAVHQQFAGPLPPPAILGEYDKVKEGFAERIFNMAEGEQIHRHKIENKSINASISTEKRGQFFALLLSLVILGGSMFLIYEGKEISGSLLAGSSLVGLAYIFITGRKKEDGDNDENNKPD